jgi:predicted glycosyltransferase
VNGSSPRKARRVLLYSHDGFGLGHLRRNLNVARRLVREVPGTSALVVAGLPGVPGLEPPDGVDLLKLP